MLVYATVFVCAYILALMVYRYDMYEKEPWYMLLLVVALGMAAAFGIGFVEDIAIESFNQHESAGGQAAIAAFFETKIRLFTLRGKPRGCLISNIATEAAENDGQVRDKLTGMFAENERIIADRLRVAQDQGQLSKNSDPHALARMIVSIALSIATRARVGDSREELSRTVGDFMAVLFPTPT